MAVRIEVATTVFDTRAVVRQKKLLSQGFKKIANLWILDIYTIDKTFSQKELEEIGSRIANPVTQSFQIKLKAKSEKLKTKNFAYAVEIGYLPGVTDNVSHTTKELIEDLSKIKFEPNEDVYTSQVTFIAGNISKKEVEEITNSLYNPLIQRVEIKNYNDFIKDGGMDIVVPKVALHDEGKVTEVNLDIPDEKLQLIGKQGIANKDGSRRGPLALDLSFMKTIQAYFKKLGRNPTDIEIESIAQTWSEHCKHTIFADPLDEIKDGLFKTCIKKATEEIRKTKGKKDFCVSVFTDNSGAIIFDDDFLITHKAETHNSPSALDPFGGAITGIVGVNRDTLGFGMGAKPVANYYGFCFANPKQDIPLYKGANFTQKMLSSRRIMDGVIDGVNAGGNQSGIPTPQGFVYFDERYRGKPLVFVGTVGIIPKKIQGKPSWIKKAEPANYIVMVGGRVGKDGIHGATFSSEAMDSGSPATAVQIGDPITQKKMSDAIVKEARDQLLYTSITDNGAGGLSCSVAEMAKESGGCLVELEKVPLKYIGLAAWEIWVSESQERMTLAVPKDKWETFHDLMQRRGVEATIIGEFTNSGRCIVTYNKKTIMDIDMEFLHNGLPKRKMETKEPAFRQGSAGQARIKQPKDITKILISIMGRLNIASYAFISQQYDHIVQGGLVLGPLQGRGRVNGDASVFRPVLQSKKGVIMSQGMYPTYSDIDAYAMAGASIDTSIRNLVAAGADPDYIAILDNFCWTSGNNPERLFQLKKAAKACYDYAILYGTPYISGKDSMFNDFKGYDSKGDAISISIPPTLLISSIGVMQDSTKAVSLDFKNPGDVIYLLGETYDELGGSEYFASNSVTSDSVPKVDGIKNKKLYKSLFKLTQNGLLASSISVVRGGLGVALMRSAIGGLLGVDVNLKNIPGMVSRDDYALFSETQGRILVTVTPENQKSFEGIMKESSFAKIGKVTKIPTIYIKGLKDTLIVKTTLKSINQSYMETFKGY